MDRQGSYRRASRGQAIALEYGVFIMMIVMALVALQRYVLATNQGRLKSGAESLGTPFLEDRTTGSVTIVTTKDGAGTTRVTRDSTETTSWN